MDTEQLATAAYIAGRHGLPYRRFVGELEKRNVRPVRVLNEQRQYARDELERVAEDVVRGDGGRHAK